MDPADILHLVWKRGWSMRQLALDAGVTGQLVSYALRNPNPTGEKIVIDFLGLPGNELWPDRYDAQGVRIIGGKGARRGRGLMRGNSREGDEA